MNMPKTTSKNRTVPSILLAYPPESLAQGWGGNPFPTTQLCLASFLESRGMKSEIYQEYPFRISDILRLIKRNRHGAVGLTCDCSNLQSCAHLATAIKENCGPVAVIVGGVHATLYHKDILEHFPQFDVIVRGEGEETLAEIMPRLGHLDTSVPGITFRKKNTLGISQDRPHFIDCDALPPLSYNLLKKTGIKNFDRLDSWWPVPSARGCSFNCAFCASGRFWKRCYRRKSLPCLIDEIRRCQHDYHVDRFFFDELAFTFDRNRIRMFCEELQRHKLNIEWCCDTRIDCVDEELLNMVHRAGCRRIHFGVESFSNRVLGLMNKKYDSDRALALLNVAHRIGIRVICNVILGYPGETDETLRDTLSRINRLDKGIFCNPIIFHMYTGTDIYDLAKKRNLVNDAQWLHGYTIRDFVRQYYPPSFLEKLVTVRKAIQHKFKKYSFRKSQSGGLTDELETRPIAYP